MKIQDHLTHDDIAWVEQTIRRFSDKFLAVRERTVGKIPSGAIDGVYDDKLAEEGHLGQTKTFWTNGFWAGILWQLYSVTKDERYAEIARHTEDVLHSCLSEATGLATHDIGYLFLPSAVLDYKLTGSEDALNDATVAANLLAGRFNPAGGFIRAWGGKVLPGFCPGDPQMHTAGVTIIDCMLNLPLLYWASEISEDPRYRLIAMRHADTAMKYFVREDGSVIHIVEFDPVTGEYVNDFGGQGFQKGSAWARGQSWGLYGFTASYKHTRKQEYLDTAGKIAGFFLSCIPEDGLIPEDFRQPDEPWVQDDIAACAASCGLIELAQLVSEDEGRAYLDAALKMLKAISEKSADFNPETDGITLRGSTAYHVRDRVHGWNKNYVYADYFFLEALLKLKGQGVYIW
ncbi:MAG: glycoside hydrolase family 88 protein [Blautia sp.]|nr:glycoside hydrolase family 88 protein [Blautia sp.]